jgi:hypothetical protein
MSELLSQLPRASSSAEGSPRTVWYIDGLTTDRALISTKLQDLFRSRASDPAVLHTFSEDPKGLEALDGFLKLDSSPESLEFRVIVDIYRLLGEDLSREALISIFERLKKFSPRVAILLFSAVDIPCFESIPRYQAFLRFFTAHLLKDFSTSRRVIQTLGDFITMPNMENFLSLHPECQNPFLPTSTLTLVRR